MANALGIDLGGVYRTVEAVQASRDARAATETGKANALAFKDAASRYAAGDKAAYGELVSIDPAKAKQVSDAYAALDDAAKAKAQEQIDMIGRAAAGILSSGDPAAAYSQLRAALPPDQQGQFPEEYNEAWVKMQLVRATEVAKIYDAQQATIAREDTQANQLALQDDAQAATSSENQLGRVERANLQDDQQQFTGGQNAQEFGNKLVLQEDSQAHDVEMAGINSNNTIREGVAKAATAAPKAMDAADTNAIFRMSAELLGGIFDQDGKLQTLDPNTRAKAQEIATKASDYFAKGMSHAAAVKQAAVDLGIAFPGNALSSSASASAAPAAPAAPAPTVNPNNPLGL